MLKAGADETRGQRKHTVDEGLSDFTVWRQQAETAEQYVTEPVNYNKTGEHGHQVDVLLDHIDIVGPRIAGGNSQAVRVTVIDICQKGAGGLPGRREYVKAGYVCRDDIFYQGLVVAFRSVKSEPWQLG